MCLEPSRQWTSTRRFLACSASYSWRSLYCIARGCLGIASPAADCACAWPMEVNIKKAAKPMSFVMMNCGSKAVWNVGQLESDGNPGLPDQYIKVSAQQVLYVNTAQSPGHQFVWTRFAI